MNKTALQTVLVPTAAMTSVGATQASDFRIVLARWIGVARLWWRCPTEKRRAWLYTAACAGLSLANVLFLLYISYVQNAFQSALSEKDEAGYFKAVLRFLGIIVVAAPFFALTDYVDSCLTVAWRSWLTQHLIRSYFAGHAYFKLKLDPAAIDNPDQRICDDVRAYTATSVSLSITIARKALTCVAFAGLLWSLAPRLAVFLIFYAVAGTWVTVAGFGRRLMHLIYSVLQQEADLRFALVHVRENAESIAFYSGDQREAELARTRLARVIATIFGKVRWEAYLSLWQNTYVYATILLPSLLLYKRYFAGELRFGDLSQAGFAFHTIERALSFIVTRLSDLSQLAAQTDRLDALLATLVAQAEGVPGGVVRKPSTDGSVALEKLTLSTPHGEMLVAKDLSLTLAPGQSLLIVGASGVGKTSLMRAVAGLWSTGSGTIAAPTDMFFLPQRPYMPLGTLRDQLTFPDSYATTAGPSRAAASSKSGAAADGLGGGSSGAGHRRRSGDDGDSGSGDEERGQELAAGGSRRLAILRGNTSSYRRLSSARGEARPDGGARGMLSLDSGGAASTAQDAELRELLETVCLPNLLARVGGLDADADWAHMLSLGEQQRISLARLLYHKPAVAFLDEATSALDTATERALYTQLQQHCRCYISIAHRRQLAAFHTHVLEATGGGAWVLHDATAYLQSLQD
ncbi:ABC transporter ATP-binding [Micractinium conductrix]|uniref:ABC transporter ATP-binding n=1 Tax=Micractinium conductrix TaxID=554055 RepID=A0A2P6V8X9_9CHLO|nr:ABC transporter ATP-binding [Micractinium conductrix]|eukprot:PSC70542.1 ABC transporter ATP-binding [Micractinium conductrix]